MINIILCGGNGTRLWPISRTLMPKQFVNLFDDKSLFQLTVQRNSKVSSKQFIVSNQNQYFLAIDQIEELDSRLASSENLQFLLEPEGRNTAPAIALACFAIDPEEVVLVTPSDHLIKNEEEYGKVLNKSKELATQGYLVTFGITPDSPQTGFGYIEAGEIFSIHTLTSGAPVFSTRDVKAFHEKPDEKTAKEYLEAGNYYWNSGMFCFKAGVYLEELKKYSPDVYQKSLDAFNKAVISNQIRIKQQDMLDIPEDSIDYAVMEKSLKVKVVPSNIDWSDLGSFDALYDELSKDEDGNTLNKNHVNIDSSNNLIYGSERKIATVDVDNLIIVDTADALLVSRKGSSQKVKNIVNEVKKDTDLHNIHLTVYRPWGTYTVLEEGVGYKIKRLEVKPGKKLSLQKHMHRNEHWIVVSGTATVTVGDKVKTLRENESTYIKMGETHRLENEGKLPLIIIEAQVGEYTCEDDIIRFDDNLKPLKRK